MTELTANTPPKRPNNFGRCSRRVTSAMMDKTETKMPAAPQPARARPKIKELTLGAAAQMRDPCEERVSGGWTRTERTAGTHNLEDGDSKHKSPFSIKDGQDLTVEKEEGGLGEEVRAVSGFSQREDARIGDVDGVETHDAIHAS
jgi:hypothetical protein